jgi:SEC-C motif-containing protein
MSFLCVCGTNKSFEDCCGRFLNDGQQAKTPEQLMRSRYSAYALGNYGEYLLRTWFPATARGLTAEELSQTSCEWRGLKIVAREQKGEQGLVEFRARYCDEQGMEHIMREKSVFQRIGGRWLYVGGEVNAAPETDSPE